MEDAINEALVEQLSIYFDELLEAGNHELCRKIIQQVKDLDEVAGWCLEEKLLNTPISSFH